MQSNIFPKRDFNEFHMNLELDKLYICDDFMSQTTLSSWRALGY